MMKYDRLLISGSILLAMTSDVAFSQPESHVVIALWLFPVLMIFLSRLCAGVDQMSSAGNNKFYGDTTDAPIQLNRISRSASPFSI